MKTAHLKNQDKVVGEVNWDEEAKFYAVEFFDSEPFTSLTEAKIHKWICSGRLPNCYCDTPEPYTDKYWELVQQLLIHEIKLYIV